ncbi:adhesion G protein-coupled receptor F5-like isoform X2 [Brienomyrus brachyistius]|uniref:adhesion G protein-coupled receptor F5-like isoform X2 n=1 Tax=Brienomyrus brachyistius TaxID=42636 RepID=UPI0020B1F025|nr:adhesion G protein-coupled receptor F5-like isoform X2 [Brienomyrus brachyistius]
MDSEKLLFIIVLMVTCTIFKAGEFAEIPHYFGTTDNKEANSPHVQVKQKRDGLTKLWTVSFDIELKSSGQNDTKGMRSALNASIFLFQLENTVNFTEVNITTVCYQNGTGFQCKCEEPLAWSYNSCVAYTPCDDIIQGTCRCIDAVPSNGHRCKPQLPTEIKLDYDIDIEVTVSDIAVINNLRNILVTTPFPYPLSNAIEIIGVNLTTVCYPNGPGFQCICEEQFAWSYDSCVAYTPCDDIIQGTCRCINGIPSDGQFCQLRPNSTTLGLTMQNVTSTDAATTYTAAKQSVSSAVTGSVTSSSTMSPVTGRFKLQMSFSMLRNFTEDLKDPATMMYKNLKINIESALCEKYKAISGFIRVEVTNFRPGSVITDFLLHTNQLNSTEIATANNELVADLVTRGYNADSDSFQGVLHGPEPFTKNYEMIYPGNTMELTCMVPESMQKGTVSWFVNDIAVYNDTKYTITNSTLKLTVKDIRTDDSGTYRCSMKDAILIFLHEELINVTNVVAPIVKLSRWQLNSPCDSIEEISLECCVTYNNIDDIEAKWMAIVELSTNVLPESNIKCFVHSFNTEQGRCDPKIFTCQVKNRGKIISEVKATLNFFSGAPECNSIPYGSGKEGDTAVVCCRENFEGTITARCLQGVWVIVADNCILSEIIRLQNVSKNLNEITVPVFLEELKNTTENLQNEIENSTATISAIVDILSRISAITQTINSDVMTNVLKTVTILVSDQSEKSWAELNSNTETQNTSSALLESVEKIAENLLSDSFKISTKNIELSKTTFTSTFSTSLNSSQILIPNQGLPINTGITLIVFTTLEFVLPSRSTGNSVNNSINGIVMLVYVNETINNVSMTFDKISKTKGNNQCIFWNFKLFQGIGGWDSTGCQLQSETNDSVTCSCNHLTSFSILMSPFVPESIEVALNYITYFGVNISVGSLVLCLIIEAFVWSVVTKNSTSHMRHVTIVNIALSLLIADIWFIIGAAVSNVGQDTPKNACSAATFFIHLFYLALFFWMLISALLLFYRTMMVFSHMSKRTMMAIAFTVGYGAPLIIALITIAVTAPKNGYFRQDDACWLNWYQTDALLSFVIPALIIVVVNLLILIVVLYKLLMRGVGENRQSEEKNALLVIARCVAVLTPIFGITWGLGIGTMVAPANPGVHITFAIFNSLQGFFILIFGTLLDSSVRTVIMGKCLFLPKTCNRIRSTSAGASSWAAHFRRGRKNFYNVSEATSSSQSSESFINNVAL